MNLDILLQSLRNQIDTIDEEMIYLLSRRFALVKQVWDIKKDTGDTPLQPHRWQEVLDNLYLEWKERWVSKDLIDDIWNRIHKESLKIESNSNKKDIS